MDFSFEESHSGKYLLHSCSCHPLASSERLTGFSVRLLLGMPSAMLHLLACTCF